MMQHVVESVGAKSKGLKEELKIQSAALGSTVDHTKGRSVGRHGTWRRGQFSGWVAGWLQYEPLLVA